MDEKKKKFDAVKMMRDARDQISHDIRDMNFEEQAAYFREHAEHARVGRLPTPVANSWTACKMSAV